MCEVFSATHYHRSRYNPNKSNVNVNSFSSISVSATTQLHSPEPPTLGTAVGPPHHSPHDLPIPTPTTKTPGVSHSGSPQVIRGVHRSGRKVVMEMVNAAILLRRLNVCYDDSGPPYIDPSQEEWLISSSTSNAGNSPGTGTTVDRSIQRDCRQHRDPLHARVAAGLHLGSTTPGCGEASCCTHFPVTVGSPRSDTRRGQGNSTHWSLHNMGSPKCPGGRLASTRHMVQTSIPPVFIPVGFREGVGTASRRGRSQNRSAFRAKRRTYPPCKFRGPSILSTPTVSPQQSRNAIQISRPRRPTSRGGRSHVSGGSRLCMAHLNSRWPLNLVPALPVGPEDTWPLHIKQVRRVTLNERLRILKELTDRFPSLQTHLDRFSHACSFFDSSIPQQADLQERESHCSLSMTDIQDLLAAGLLREVDPASNDPNCTTFSVSEKAKKRRRWIVHPGAFNDLVRPLLRQVSIPSTSEVMRRVSSFKYAASLDFKSYYHQFALNEESIAGSFTFHHNGKTYATTTIPTGAAPCPLMAQAYSEAIAASVKEILGDGIEVDVYIDNVRLLSNDRHTLSLAVRTFFAMSTIFQVDINESLDEVLAADPERYEFLGILFDHSTGATRLGSKTMHKLSEIGLQKEWEDPNITVHRMLQIHGLLMYSTLVSGTLRGQFYYPQKFMRRRAQEAAPLQSPAHVWPSTHQAWNMWCSTSLRNDWRFHAKSFANSPHGTITTDASRSGFGAIIETPSGVYYFARKWRTPWTKRHINVLESRALLFGLMTADKIAPEVEAWDIRIDNTSALFSSEKGYSASWLLNYLAVLINKTSAFKRRSSFIYIRSKDNNADGLSRYFQTPSTTLAPHHNMPGRTRGEGVAYL